MHIWRSIDGDTEFFLRNFLASMLSDFVPVKKLKSFILILVGWKPHCNIIVFQLKNIIFLNPNYNKVSVVIFKILNLLSKVGKFENIFFSICLVSEFSITWLQMTLFNYCNEASPY